MKREDEGRMRDILQSALQIQCYLESVTHDDFMQDLRTTQDAVLRRLEIMGEAAGRICQETRVEFPSVPFQRLKGMRNILAHDYGNIDLPMVWDAVERELPSLITTLRPLFPLLTIQQKKTKS